MYTDLGGNLGGYPGNQFSGRQLLKGADRYFEFGVAYRRLNRKLIDSNVRRELQLGEFYEKPGDRKRRLRSERHRRRFQEMVCLSEVWLVIPCLGSDD